MADSGPRRCTRLTEVGAGSRLGTAPAWITAAVVATLLAVSSDSAAARKASPFRELDAAFHNLFAPPRRARAAKAKHAGRQAIPPGKQVAPPGKQAAPPDRQAATPDREAAMPSGSHAPKAGAGSRSEAAATRAGPGARQPAPSPHEKQVAGRSVPPDRAIPQPPTRPPEAPPRRETMARSTPPKDVNVETRARRAGGEPRHEQTAALPPTDKASPGGPDAAKDLTKDQAPPDQPPQQADQPPPPSPCQLRLPDIAAIKILLPINNGTCTAEEVVRLDAVTAKDGRRVAVTPPATLRCPMAESFAHWIRDEVASVAQDLGAPVKSVTVDTSFECRPRNHIAGAKLSEHGHANAVDLRAFTLANGGVVGLTDKTVQREARERLREAACRRFTTVLGPGADGYHETHIHVDLAERRSGYRICQWDVRDPTEVAGVPLPPERPVSAPPRVAKRAKSSSRD